MMNEQTLRVALAKKGIPQVALARMIGVDHSTFSRWKKGWYPVPEKYRSKLAKILNVRKSELFERGAS